MIELRRIRVLTDDDLAPLVASSVAEGFRFLARLVDEWETGAMRFDLPGELLLGVYDGASLVAVGGLTGDPYGSDPTVGRLRRVYVSADRRRRGAGGRLVRALEAEALGTYRELVLRTDSDAAARFYEALGYRRLRSGGAATHHRLMTSEPDIGRTRAADSAAPSASS